MTTSNTTRTGCARTAADVSVQIENQILNSFDSTLKELRAHYRSKNPIVSIELAHLQNKVRATRMATAITRVATQLHGAGIDAFFHRTESDGWHHTVDPLVSFSLCSSCGGSTTYAPPCRFEAVA